MEQKTGIRGLYDEFFRGYGAESSLFSAKSLLYLTYKQLPTPRFFEGAAMHDVAEDITIEQF